jgi:hypothetical protein
VIRIDELWIRTDVTRSTYIAGPALDTAEVHVRLGKTVVIDLRGLPHAVAIAIPPENAVRQRHLGVIIAAYAAATVIPYAVRRIGD